MEAPEPQLSEAKSTKEVIKRFRLTVNEAQKIEAKAARTGLTFSEYCRRAALGKPVVEKIPPDLRRQLTAVGGSLQQLTRLAVAGQLGEVEAATLQKLLACLLQTLR